MNWLDGTQTAELENEELFGDDYLLCFGTGKTNNNLSRSSFQKGDLDHKARGLEPTIGNWAESSFEPNGVEFR